MKKIIQTTLVLFMLFAIVFSLYVWISSVDTEENQAEQPAKSIKQADAQGITNYTEYLQITVLDIGKADCILIQADESNMMIDTGGKKETERIFACLAEKGIKSLDYLVISHFDKDHAGGAADIITKLDIGQIIQPDYEENSNQFTAIATDFFATLKIFS